MRLKNALVFEPLQGFVRRDVCIDKGLICAEAEGESLDFETCYLIPGLIDLHMHGCVGQDVSDASQEGLAKMAQYLCARGVTQFCPTGMTVSIEQLEAICGAVRAYKQNESKTYEKAKLAGLYLEGPFLSMQKKGAQNADFLQTPNVALARHLQAASGGLVKIMGIAPELSGALDFIRELKDEMCLSLAHSACNYEEAKAAFEAGAKQVSHLFNAMNAFSHKDPGLVGAALDSDCFVELICDGVHIHPAMVRAVFRLFSAERVILISDSMRATGMPNGSYTLGGQRVHVQDGRAVLPDGSLAGSVSDLMSCLCRAVSFGVPLHDAVKAATVNPAKALHRYDQVGSLCVGKRADILVLNSDLSLRTIFLAGKEQLFSKPHKEFASY